MQKSEKTSKQYEQLGRQIANLLKDFERNREWADIGNWLSRLQPILASKKHHNLPHKIQLAKRLAQCLNPNLPAGIHSNTLSVYNTIFTNFECRSQLLPIFSIGLFPFFQYSSSALKFQLVKIFQNFYIKTADCLMMITSLVNSTLMGLNENNQELAKKIYGLYEKIAIGYGRMWVDGAVWINILKSPKVRIAGFKYFMKVFKDRDKLKKQESINQEKTKQEEKKEEEAIITQVQTQVQQVNLIGSFNDSFISDHLENQANIQIFSQLSKIKNLQDSQKTRFPNFSTLVVSALCQCLQSPFSDTLVRRSALDLLIFYLNVNNKQLITEKDAIHLVTVLLQTIKIKQYSLTRRVYTYLFGQPNTEGIYTISQPQRNYQIHLLQISLKKMLALPDQYSIQVNNSQGNLMIIQIILKDHEQLRKILLPQLAYQILTYLRIAGIQLKRVIEFYLNVIQPSNDVFAKRLEDEIVSEKAVQNPKIAKEIVLTIEHFYTLKNQIQTTNKSTIPPQQLTSLIHHLLTYLQKTNLSFQKNSIQTLQLCQKLLTFAPKCPLSPSSISILNSLISFHPDNTIYAHLLTLHPHPPKEILLPFVNQISLSIVCIGNLLEIGDELDKEEKEKVFFAIFRLLNCHLWEDQAIQFIRRYKQKYGEFFQRLIDQVDPAEWVMYWRKMGGDVDGGVIRMLKNLDDDNHLNKQLSKKWLQNSKQICSKIIDPVYKQLKTQQPTISNIKQLYLMIQRIFLIQKSDFTTFFFLQRERYFLPLIDKIFECIYSNEEELKASSIAMLEFLMERAGDVEEKLGFIQVTIERTVFLLRKTLGGKGNYQREIQIIQYFISMVELYQAFKGNIRKVEKLQTFVEDSQLYQTMAMGLKETNVPYLRTLYIDFIQKSIQAFAQISKDPKFMSQIITCILEKLFMMLRQTDVTALEQIIKGKSLSQSQSTAMNRRKKSEMSVSVDPSNVSQSQFNVEAKYAQVIQLWNSVKFLVNVSIKNQIGDLPIEKLLSIILQSFPFSQIKYEQVSPEMVQINYQQLQQQIRNMTGLKKQVLEIFQTLWQNYQHKIITFLIDKGDPRVLIHGSVDPNAVIKAITKSSHCQKLSKYFKSTKFSLPKSTLHYNTDILLIENHINYFLYLYLLYCNLSLKNLKKVYTFIELALNLIRSLNITSHVQTKLWILETLYCLYERIPFRDLQLESGKIKEFQDMAKDIIDQLVGVVAKARGFTHRVEIKTGIFNIFSKQQGKQSSLFDFVKIFPPTIHHMSQFHQQKYRSKKAEHLVPSQDLISHFLFSKWTNLTQPLYIQYLSIAVIKTLNKLFVPLITNIYQNDFSKISPMTRQWLMVLFPLYENKSEENQAYLETVAEFLHGLLANANFRNEIVKNMRKSIIQIYMGNDFFKCTKNTLNNWKFIIDCCTENYDLLGELLSKQGLFEGIFTRKAESTRLKIKNFQRVCFVIYAGRVDKYQNKLRVVLQSLNQVMKQESPSSALLILILFCIRILFMRLSQSSLSRMFKSFWPSLITLLIQIYTKPALTSCTNLLLAGLKVIQLVHALELQQFNIHKWIFVFDYFGIRIDSQTQSQQLLTGTSKKILTPFKFPPLLSRYLPQNSLKCTFIPQSFPDQSIQPSKRKIIVKETSTQSDEQLRNHTLILMQYMIDINQRRVNVAREEIEDLIQADFISLDDYIFEVK